MQGLIATIYKIPPLCQPLCIYPHSPALSKMLGSHRCHRCSADVETEAQSGSMIVQGLNNLAEEVDIGL